MTKILLIDNGSKRAASVHNLRNLARALSEKIGAPVSPVSLQHADSISPESLNGSRALTLKPFMEDQLNTGEQNFILLPLFFGPSRALSGFVPDAMEELAVKHGAFHWTMAETLSSPEAAEPELVQILLDHITEQSAGGQEHIILVDHGSPSPAVTQVRENLTQALAAKLSDKQRLHQAVMERRKGKSFDFNGELLEDKLEEIGAKNEDAHIIIAMLFISPGRHAGAGGDIESICQQASNQYPNLNIRITKLVGEHSGLIDLLEQRYQNATKA